LFEVIQTIPEKNSTTVNSTQKINNTCHRKAALPKHLLGNGVTLGRSVKRQKHCRPNFFLFQVGFRRTD